MLILTCFAGSINRLEHYKELICERLYLGPFRCTGQYGKLLLLPFSKVAVSISKDIVREAIPRGGDVVTPIVGNLNLGLLISTLSEFWCGTRARQA